MAMLDEELRTRENAHVFVWLVGINTFHDKKGRKNKYKQSRKRSYPCMRVVWQENKAARTDRMLRSLDL
jgi:hypothetical protein